jgi:HPt (histidine-containing phosphotransfer) domain-containing protein
LDERVESPPPILDARLADQWFAEGDSADQALDRTMVTALRTDVAPRLAALQASVASLTAKEAVHELHKLRGAVASFGFSACARHLEQLEHSWLQRSVAERGAGLKTAHEAFLAGLKELLRRFPHLGEP